MDSFHFCFGCVSQFRKLRNQREWSLVIISCCTLDPYSLHKDKRDVASWWCKSVMMYRHIQREVDTWKCCVSTQLKETTSVNLLPFERFFWSALSVSLDWHSSVFHACLSWGDAWSDKKVQNRLALITCTLRLITLCDLEKGGDWKTGVLLPKASHWVAQCACPEHTSKHSCSHVHAHCPPLLHKILYY